MILAEKDDVICASSISNFIKKALVPGKHRWGFPWSLLYSNVR